LTAAFGGLGGAGGGLGAGGGPLNIIPVANAKGNVFDRGRLIPFERGDVFSQPHLFQMAGGNTGIFAEAGPEAIMPLERGSDGRLGVRSNGGSGGTVINHAPVFSSDISPQSRAWVMGQIQLSERRMAKLVEGGRSQALLRRSDAFTNVAGL
jgi:lambda family phage tail tape measure protein